MDATYAEFYIENSNTWSVGTLKGTSYDFIFQNVIYLQ